MSANLSILCSEFSLDAEPPDPIHLSLGIEKPEKSPIQHIETSDLFTYRESSYFP